MTSYATALKFFEACETNEGWEGCKEYVVNEAAPFKVQAAALADITTIQGYTQWVKAFGTITAPGATYELHLGCFDEKTRKAVFYATYHAKHTGEGGPVEPTNKEMHTDYVYVLDMNAEDKITAMSKIWNDGFALKQVGWME
mmetsp:Transcript_4236/g.5579  ORF Transcript_4236/g.5579 Transcript_4236/m.5579 type:complete len:142 (+) Transcript_4236:208-633(+)|eukprot:CAMPEP_0198144494 /NCGR_PEP_ID=MMETSP1443-20131203/16360_1 /TAXON_ID=186043 /ORGANISM="Entomoneis sp., Strain CCMP2396" /LENGTH=141 /DNA_ID=CAMNT_0043807901 /DNA_START=129 /DNA_END=554 /DNA_ORIENTATION=+